MAYALFFGVIALNLICVMMKKNSRIIALLSVIALAIVMGYAQTTFGDLSTYRENYESGNIDENVRFESGYIFINLFFLEHGFNFNQFRIAIFLISALCLFLMARKYKPNYNLLVLLYTLSIFYFLSVALRYFLGFAVLFLGLAFLLKEKKLNVILFAALVLLAAQFHKSFVVCFLFLPCFLPQKALQRVNKVLFFLSFISMGIIAMMIVAPGTISVISSFLNSFASDIFTDLESMSDSYFGGRYSRRYVIYVLFYIINCLCTYVGIKYMVSRGDLSQNACDKILCIQLLFMVMTPTVLLSQTMMRLIFIALMLQFVMAAKLANLYKNERILIPWGKIRLTRGTYVFVTILSAATWFTQLYLIGDLGFNLMNFLSQNTFTM